jgi:hypothetical protein
MPNYKSNVSFSSTHYPYRSNDDVDFFALFHEKSHFCFNEFFGHGFGVSPSAITLFLNIDLYKFSSQGLDLLSRGRSGIKPSNDCAKTPSLIEHKTTEPSQKEQRSPTVAMALKPATPAPMTKTLQGGI